MQDATPAQESQEALSATDLIVKTIMDSALVSPSDKELEDMLSCGAVNEDELNDGRVIHGVARVHLTNGQSLLVQNPWKVGEGYIMAFTPTEAEGQALIAVAQIARVDLTL